MTESNEHAAQPSGDGAPAVPPAGQSRVRRLRLAGIVLVLLVAVLVAVVLVVVTGPPTRDDLIRRAGLDGKAQLVIGVKDDQPGVSLRDPATGLYSGFDIDIAYMIASDLGFRKTDVRFLPIESEDRARMQARDGDHFVTVDLVVASYSITPDRIQAGVHFSAPYLETKPALATRRDHATVSSYGDMRGQKVCSLTTSTTITLLTQAGVQPVERNRISECVDALLHGEVDGVATDAAILAGFVAKYPDQLRDHDIGTAQRELYGVNCGTVPGMCDLVNLTLYHAKYDPSDSRWKDAYDRELRPEQPVNLPEQVAVDTQPAVPAVRVREWPWQRWSGTR